MRRELVRVIERRGRCAGAWCEGSCGEAPDWRWHERRVAMTAWSEGPYGGGCERHEPPEQARNQCLGKQSAPKVAAELKVATCGSTKGGQAGGRVVIDHALILLS